MPFAIADSGVVNDRVEAPKRVDLGRDSLGLCDHGEIADDDRFSPELGLFRVRRSRRVAGMQDDRVALIGEKPASHQTEAIGRTGNEDARHVTLPTLRLPHAYRSPRRASRLGQPGDDEGLGRGGAL